MSDDNTPMNEITDPNNPGEQPTVLGLSVESRGGFNTDSCEQIAGQSGWNSDRDQINNTKRLDAVFISDLHLNPEKPDITAKFYQFTNWALYNTRSIYILGDFLHVWPGDDAMTPWSLSICQQLALLVKQGIIIYFMSGNRDFLIGKTFLNTSGMIHLTEPTIFQHGATPVLLVHGDRYCTKDKAHQWLRIFTRHSLFSKLFLCLPLRLRNQLVKEIRRLSQSRQRTLKSYSTKIMDLVPEVMLQHMQQHNTVTVIHGHTHKPGLTKYQVAGQVFKQYILSDWDTIPQILCYDQTMGFYFTHLLW